jgi:hypothetical protein
MPGRGGGSIRSMIAVCNHWFWLTQIEPTFTLTVRNR